MGDDVYKRIKQNVLSILNYAESLFDSSVPSELNHYTGYEAACNIIKGISKKNICFWIFSNKDKNDKKELKKGLFMYNSVKRWIENNCDDESSFIYEHKNFCDSYLLSFNHGNVSAHMLEEYGKVKLVFDLSMFYSHNDFFPCEYLNDFEVLLRTEKLVKKSKEYYAMLEHITKEEKYKGEFLQWILFVSHTLSMYTLSRPYFVKGKKWKDEKEWRYIYFAKDNESPKYTEKGTNYLEREIPLKCLKKIIIYESNVKSGKEDTIPTIQKVIEFRKLLNDKGYNDVLIRVEKKCF